MGRFVFSNFKISKIMTSLLCPYPLLLIFLLPFFCLGISTQSNNSSYPDCPNYYCGNISISYPFWKIGNKPAARFCGYEGFGITCSTVGNRSIPKLTLGNNYYIVQSIYYDTSDKYPDSSNIVLSVVGPGPKISCPRVHHNITLGTLPLFLTMDSVDLSFHYDCNRCPSLAIEIPCLERNERKSCVHVMNTRKGIDWDEYSCSDQVVTTVSNMQANDLLKVSNQFGELLLRGFKLEWWARRRCEKCEKSHGRCGHHDMTGFICFCSDGTTSKGHCNGSSRSQTIKILYTGVGSALLCYMIIYILCSILISLPTGKFVASLKHKTEDEKIVESFVIQYGALSPIRYRYSDIKEITNSFEAKLGHGGFGTVFKGKLFDGRLVAVKVLNTSKAKGQEFINEVASISRTSHVNIVTLVGFCFEYRKRALVYEYMPNGSLEKFIHGHKPTNTAEHIGVKKLYEIAHGIASGLDYLHRGCNTRILHLDIKPHNILLDEDFCPKIADFGLAKLYSRKESIVSMLEPRGTIGYIAPEVYNKNFGRVSHKSDVYSYGMMLLEMVGGRKNIEVGVGSERISEIYFPDWIYMRLHKDEFLLDGVTTTEENDYARKMTIIGLWCIQPAPNQRPSIDQVIEMLEGSMEALEVPPKPIFCSPPRSMATDATLQIMPKIP